MGRSLRFHQSLVVTMENENTKSPRPRFALPVIPLDDSVQELDTDVVVGELDLATGKIIIPGVSFEEASQSGSLEERAQISLEDDDELYRELREMNVFECKCAAVVIVTILVAVICLFYGVYQVDYYMGRDGEFTQAINNMDESMTTFKHYSIRNVDRVRDGAQIANQAVESLKFVQAKIGDIFKIITSIDDFVDMGADWIIKKAETFATFDEDERRELEYHIKQIMMGAKGLAEEQLLRKAAKEAADRGEEL